MGRRVVPCVAAMTAAPLHFEVGGRPDAVPVVFLHAFPLSSEMWAAQRDALAPMARTVAFDVRGLGRSGLGPGAFMLEHVVDDLLALLDDLRVRRAILCGLSMGGYVALRAVERAPERVAGLLLADTRAEADGNEAKVKRAAALRALVDERALPAYATGFLAGALSPATLAQQPALVARLRAWIEAQPVSGVRAALLALASRTDQTHALAGIRVPTRVVVGADDALTPPEVARALAAAIPGADVEEIPGAGHFSNLENPAAFDAALTRLVSDVGRAWDPS